MESKYFLSNIVAILARKQRNGMSKRLNDFKRTSSIHVVTPCSQLNCSPNL